jgi:indolepyruvate ferredoxin oxidoreductase beta subunit
MQFKRRVAAMNNLNIMIVGVGGQGTLLASRVLGRVALKKGFDVKVSEVHGMSQRGGSVVTYVKMDSKVFSPLIEKGEADVILAFEKLEALRWAEYLNPEGTMIVNTQQIDPMPVITGAVKYPESIIEKLAGKIQHIAAVDALKTARECGNTKAVNIVLIGILAQSTPFGKEVWLEAIQEVVPAKALEVNLRAFEAGYRVERNS